MEAGENSLTNIKTQILFTFIPQTEKDVLEVKEGQKGVDVSAFLCHECQD